MSASASTQDLDKEALRQQMLLRALWRDARTAVVGGWLGDTPERWRRGIAAYQANAGALAERALAAAFPTVAAIVGDESFAALARAYWHDEAPSRGDVAEWGGTLPSFIAASAQLASEPYLPDVARLDWAVYRCDRAADGPSEPIGLALLGSVEPSQLRVSLLPGTAMLASAHPVVAIWQAHRSNDADRFAPVRSAFAEGRAETALVWRRGWRVEVEAIGADESRLTAALLDGAALAEALDRAGAGFDFEPWLIHSLRGGRIAAVVSTATPRGSSR